MKGEDTLAALELHDPAIKHMILSRLSKHDKATLNTPEGRQTIREEAMQAITDFLAEEQQPRNIADILFTNFMIE